MPEPLIPEKLYFKIGEVSKIVGVKPYVLRYWETEFKEIGPIKSRSNQRLYRRKDVQALLAIKRLLYKEGFTIGGARKKIREFLRNNGEDPAKKGKKKAAQSVKGKNQMNLGLAGDGGKKLILKIKKELEELRKIISVATSLPLNNPPSVF
jgi:DNA-binding transcriptional MerR regulator